MGNGKLMKNYFARSCSEENGIEVCTCDCRINLYGCPNDANNIIALKCLVPFTLIIVVISLSFLYYRVKVKGQSVFFPATRERGLIRPRPQDSFHIAVGVFNFSQMIVLLLLIIDLFPNVTFAEIAVHIPKLLGFACAVLYPISIIYSTPILKQTTYSLRIQWNPNKIFIDGLAIYLMLGPLLTIVPLTALTGYFADRHDYNNANNIFIVQSIVWSSWTIQYFITLLYVYYKLISMLKEYSEILQRRRNENPDADIKIRKLRSAAHNLTWIVFAVFLIFFLNSIEGILVGINYHKEKDVNKNICVTIYTFISWNFTIPVLTFIGQIIFLYDTLKNKKSSQNQRSNTFDRVNNIPSHLEQRSATVNQEISQSKSGQKSKSSLLKKSSDNSISVDVKTTVFSTVVTGSSTLVPWETKSGDFERSRNNTKDVDKWNFVDSDIVHHYVGHEEEDKSLKNIPGTIVSPDGRKSWLVKKPIRSVSAVKDTADKNSLFLQD
ncbi:hypothetical protein C1645_786899 [Glomus cerebriforme]|uniref:Uncharacterized protein n=1 Tax=Glomus cerebriforme TaxID=658196 RepID=A0A397SE66_9GLOM|nr:hypothetical protein C1645_786899 [Glomus cerebriforme]